MTVQRSFKRIVRARMVKTGESYTAARAALLAAESKPSEGPALSVSDEVIRERTGHGWEEWFDLLDEAGAAAMPRADMLRWVGAEHGLEGWPANAVTVNYERARSLRAVGEHEDGFTVTASKTIAVPVESLYAAFVDAGVRARWLPGAQLAERTILPHRSARFDWNGGASRLHVFFAPKGADRSVVSLQHERLADGEAAERMKAFWRSQVSVLKEELER
jgi:hypothetical protein